MARAVTVIPPTIQPITHLARNAVVRRRVAAYARVSTSSEEQLTSYEAQVDYYTRFIQSKPTSHLSSSNGTRGSIFGLFFSLSSIYWTDFEAALP